MEHPNRTAACSFWFIILTWGALWGIFEATVGYLLHLLPFSVGFLVWYPVACFFMVNVYRKTQQTKSILCVGALAACIKLLNLFLPGRIDRVLNPAISILFEALSMAVVIWVINHLILNQPKTLWIKALTVLAMNFGWRILYIVYLLFLVPDWIREISVISNPQAFLTFFLVYNLLTSLILFLGAVTLPSILRPVEAAERRVSALFSTVPNYYAGQAIKVSLSVFLLGSNIALQLLL
jgi:hypothetical protein